MTAFAGLRFSELEVATAADIDFEELTIKVCSRKKIQIRLVRDLPETVWRWLDHSGGVNLSLNIKNLKRRFKCLFGRTGIEGDTHDLRFSCIVNLLEITENPNKVCSMLNMGISVQHMLGLFYNGSKKEAMAYFAVKPPQEPEN